jgi:hypothetical protein
MRSQSAAISLTEFSIKITDKNVTYPQPQLTKKEPKIDLSTIPGAETPQKMGITPFPQNYKCGKLVDNICGKLKMWKIAEKSLL